MTFTVEQLKAIRFFCYLARKSQENRKNLAIGFSIDSIYTDTVSLIKEKKYEYNDCLL